MRRALADRVFLRFRALAALRSLGDDRVAVRLVRCGLRFAPADFRLVIVFLLSGLAGLR